MSEKFKLKLSNYNRNISSEILQLRQDGDFFDVTLVGEDGCHIDAHKIVLSANSILFKTMFKIRNHPHPLIYMKGLNSSDLETLISFVYNGQVTVNKEKLNEFLTLARDWKINGLEERLDETVQEVFGEIESFSEKSLEDRHLVYETAPLAQSEKEKDLEKQEIKLNVDMLIPLRKSSYKTKLKIQFKKEKCYYCEKLFPTRFQVERHKRTLHYKRDQPVKCSKTYCGATFDTVDHKIEHAKACVFKCTWNDCGREIKRKDVFESHMRAHGARPQAVIFPIHKPPKKTLVVPIIQSDMEAKLKGIWNKIKQ